MKYIIAITLLVFVAVAAVSLWSRGIASHSETFPGSFSQEFLEQFIADDTLRETESETGQSLRGLQTTPALKCRIVVVNTAFGADHVNDYMCLPIFGDRISEFSYSLDLPSFFLADHGNQLEVGNRDILIEGARLMNGYISIPDNAIIQLIQLLPQTRSVVDTPEYETRKLLVVRVSTSDSSPTLTAAELREKTFADRALTLRSQYLACSQGKLDFQPAPNSLAPGRIFGGVMDIQLNLKVTNLARQNLTNYAVAATQLALGADISEVIDNVLFCHPPGTKGDWVSYAILNNPLAVFNDLWCGYISATMHEVGHTIGFRHSNQDGMEYGDMTDYMGASYGTDDWPAICFNGQKNWQSGWYADRSIAIDPNDGSWKGYLAAFVDYDKTKSTEYVVIKVGANLYLQYNRAKGINFQTREMRNQMTIVREDLKGSELLAGLDGLRFNTTLFRQEGFGQNGETLFIAVCDTELGDGTSNPDKMWVSIGLKALDCSKIIKGAAPTTAPSWVPPDRGQKCDDDMSSSFSVGVGLGNQDCQWLRETPEMQPYLCVKGQDAYSICAETCRKCTDACVDEAGYFTYKGTVVNCAWVRSKDYSEWDSICTRGDGPFERCRETCNSCRSSIDSARSCDDSQNGSFFVFGVGQRKCAWLAQPAQAGFVKFLCTPDNPIFHLCEETCGKCFDSCVDDTSVSFPYNGINRNCLWVSARPSLWGDACTDTTIRNSCRETCNSCS